jgi:hypothetical protein
MVTFSNSAYNGFEFIDVCNRPLQFEVGDNTLTIEYKQMWNAGGGKFHPEFYCYFERTNPSNGVEFIRYYLLTHSGIFRYNDGIIGLFDYYVINHQVTPLP